MANSFPTSSFRDGEDAAAMAAAVENSDGGNCCGLDEKEDVEKEGITSGFSDASSLFDNYNNASLFELATASAVEVVGSRRGVSSGSAGGGGRGLSSSARGKKRSAKEKESGVCGGGGNEADHCSNGHSASWDAHLMMAVTQAINVLISFLKKEEGVEAQGMERKQGETMEETQEKIYKHAAIPLAALSYFLLNTVVTDRTLMESITMAASHQSSSLPSSSSGLSQVYNSSTSEAMAIVGSMSSSMNALEDEVLDGGRKQWGGIMNSPGMKGYKQMISTHAKTVVGRALTSGVMGALWAMETLGKITLVSDGNNDSELAGDGFKAGGGNNISNEKDITNKVEQALLRKSLWSSLMALETAFQLNPRPKLLSVSTVTTPTGCVRAGGLSRGGASSGMAGGTSGSSANNLNPNAMDFDGMMSAVSAAMMGGIGGIGIAEGISTDVGVGIGDGGGGRGRR